MFWAEAFGFIAMVLGVMQSFPQARKIRRLGHGQGVSALTWVLMTGSSAAWLGHGIRIGSPSLIASTIASAVMNFLVVAALVRSRREAIERFIVMSSTMVVFTATFPLWMTNIVLFAFTLSRLPQVAQSWKSKRNRTPGSAVSMQALSLSIACLLSWEVYSLLWGSFVLVGTTTIALIVVLVVAYLELTNEANRKGPLLTT